MKDKILETNYDVVIIGGGIGGLICGSILAKTGLKVLIVEQHSQPGGCCQSFKRGSFLFNAGADVIIGGCKRKGILRHILDSIGVKIDFVPIEPLERVFFPRETLEIPLDLNKYIKILAQQFPDEKNNVTGFFKKIFEGSISTFFRCDNGYQNKTYSDLLNIFFENSKLKDFFSVQSRYLGLSPTESSATYAISVLKRYFSEGIFQPIGGFHAFINSIVDTFKRFGGKLLLSNRVTNILVKNNKIQGIMIERDKELKTKVIISNADIQKTFFELLGQDNLSDNYIAKLKRFKKSVSFFVIYLGVQMPKEKLEGKNGLYIKYNINRNLDKGLYISIPSLYDNTLSNKGSHIIQIYRHFPYKYNEVSDWEECKYRLLSETMSVVEEIIPEILNHIVVQECATPKTFENYTLNSEGVAYGWAQIPSQVFKNGFSSVTPIKDLYLTGHWTNWGGGVLPVCISGWLTAKQVLLKK